MDYFEHPYTSNSDLSKLSDKYRNPDFHEAYRIGTLIDSMITEWNQVDYINYRILNRLEYIYTKEDFDLCRNMKKAFLSDKFCADLLKMCAGQCEIYNDDLEFNFDNQIIRLSCKIKYDIWSWLLNWGGDIKSTTATSMDQFLAAINHFDYDRQRFFYMKNANAKKDVLIGISKIAPYPVFKVFINVGDEIYKRGEAKAKPLIKKIAIQKLPF